MKTPKLCLFYPEMVFSLKPRISGQKSSISPVFKQTLSRRSRFFLFEKSWLHQPAGKSRCFPNSRKIHKIPLAQWREMVYTRIAQQSRNDSTAQEFSVLPALREASAARERETPGFDFAPQRTKGQHSPGVFRSSRSAGSERRAREGNSGI